MQSVVSIALEFQVWGISSWAILSWVSLVIWNCNGFALPHSLIGLKNVCRPPHQSRKPCATWSLAVFFLLGGLLVFALTSYQLLWCLPLVLVTVAITHSLLNSTENMFDFMFWLDFCVSCTVGHSCSRAGQCLVTDSSQSRKLFPTFWTTDCCTGFAIIFFSFKLKLFHFRQLL